MKKNRRRVPKQTSLSVRPLPSAQIGASAYWLVLLRYLLYGVAVGFLLPWVSQGVHWIKGVLHL